MGQLSFYSADARPRALSDLEGVLCGRGQVVLFGRGTTARLSVVVGAPPPPPPDDGPTDGEPTDDEPADGDPADGEPSDDPDDVAHPGGAAVDLADLEFLDLDPEELAAALAPRVPAAAAAGRGPRHTPGGAPPAPEGRETAAVVAPTDPVAQWRARALCCAFRVRGVEAELDRAPDGRPVVRSAFRADLVDLGRRWTRGAVKAVPDEVDLDGPRLRLWVLAAGRQRGPAYVLGLDPHAEDTHGPLLAASRRAGLGATLGGDRHDPCLRIVGRRRQRRLRELVGDPPKDPAGDVWPE